MGMLVALQAFSKKKIDKRKEWLTNENACYIAGFQ